MRGTGSAIETFHSNLLLVIGRDIFGNVIDRGTKVELQLCACYGNDPGDEPPIDGKDDEL